jgi:Cu+-exporting ATPase
MAKDPICNMNVDESTAMYTYEHGSRTYYFCGPGCKAAFSQDPAKWTSADQRHSHHRGCGCGGH